MHNKIDNLKEIKGLTRFTRVCCIMGILLTHHNWPGNSIGMNIARLGGLGGRNIFCVIRLYFMLCI